MSKYPPPPLTHYQMISIIRNGLKKTQFPKKIIIVGAGMAGLVAASLLKDAGHHVIILEATERVGGRVYTIRSPFSNGLYLNAGAMRIPHTHYLTLEYIKKFRLPVNQFNNTTPYDPIYVNGIKTRKKNYQQNPDILQYPVAPHEKGKTAEELFFLAVKPVLDFINQDPQKNWSMILKEFDKYSMESFLRHNPVGVSLSSGAVEMIKVLLDYEGFPGLSFLEILREFLILSYPNIRFYEITGGNDQLPFAFLPQLRENILFEQKVTKIIQNNNQVTIHSMHTKTSQPYKITGDIAIITIPFSTLQFVEVEPYHSFSHKKRQAIRELHYVPSTKIGIEFKNRFWEREGIYGGQTVTDLPIRFAYYPSHGLGTEGPAVVLASYTWEDDGLPWISLTEEERVLQALEYLATIHGKQVYREFVTGTVKTWILDPYFRGAFSMFNPEQETDLYPYIPVPEGRVHFAGEHTSLTHSWIQGAIESGIRVALEVNDLPRAISVIEKV
jgi:monoamine oxidase